LPSGAITVDAAAIHSAHLRRVAESRARAPFNHGSIKTSRRDLVGKDFPVFL